MTNNQSSLIDNQLEMPSTPVENIRQIRLFLQNKPNFPHFSPENEDCAKKQTQNKPNQSQFWANFRGEQSQTKPIQSQFQTLFFKNWELSMSPVEVVSLDCIIDDYGNIQIEL
jgi:hypothetical protein